MSEEKPHGYRGNRPRMGGPRRTDAAPVRPPAPGPHLSAPIQRTKKHVLFVCIGNSCRSQMAEGFARAYGDDILVARSAGTSPAAIIQPLTSQVMALCNVRLDGQFPKGLEILAREHFDVIVNMSGQKLPALPVRRFANGRCAIPSARPRRSTSRLPSRLKGSSCASFSNCARPPFKRSKN